MLIRSENGLEKVKDTHASVGHGSRCLLINSLNFLGQMCGYRVMELVEAQMKFTGRIAILFAYKDFCAVFELHVGCFAREHKGLHTEQLPILDGSGQLIDIEVKLAMIGEPVHKLIGI